MRMELTSICSPRVRLIDRKRCANVTMYLISLIYLRVFSSTLLVRMMVMERGNLPVRSNHCPATNGKGTLGGDDEGKDTPESRNRQCHLPPGEQT